MDLANEIIQQLIVAGVPKQHVKIAGIAVIATMSNSDACNRLVIKYDDMHPAIHGIKYNAYMQRVMEAIRDADLRKFYARKI